MSAVKRHILVISQYFYPEEFRINDICSEWVKRGYDVTVITGIPNYPQGKYYKKYGVFSKRKEVYNGINIIRLVVTPRRKGKISLAINYLSFVVSGFFWQICTNINADIVFIFEVSPMTQALPGVWYAKKLNVPCYLYVTDLWPENVEIVVGLKNRILIGMIEKCVLYIYDNCSKIFTSSRGFIDAIIARGVSKSILEFWPYYAEDFYRKLDKNAVKISEIPQDNKCNIIFAGNIGEAQGLDILVETAKVLKEKACLVRFNIVGDGRYKNKLIDKIVNSKVSEFFNFVSKQPAYRIPEFMAVCDATLICLKENKILELTIPSKLQSCMACGIPIIIYGSGEACEIVNFAQAGICCPSRNVNDFVGTILLFIAKSNKQKTEMGFNAVKYYKKYFNKKILMDKMCSYIDMEKK